MSPKQGRRRTAGKRGGGKSAGRRIGPAEVRRLGLLVFGVVFVLLFAIVAIAVGIGHPSVPSGSVAVVEDAPGNVGEVTKAKFDHALEQAAAGAHLTKLPKPGEPRYDELKEAAMSSLFEAIWLQGLAAEMGVSVTEKEIAAELKKLKKQSFKNEAEYKKFLKEAKYTQADVNERVKLQILSQRLQQTLAAQAPKPSKSEIESYYEAAKSTQFTQKPTRDVRMVVNKDREKAKKAREALTKDDSAKNWKKVAKQYSEDTTTKETGGLQRGIQEDVLEEPLNAAVFGSPEGKVEGVRAKRGYTVFEVVGSAPESVQDLKTVEAQIQSTLTQRAEQEYLSSFVAGFDSKWGSRTYCASGYVIERCANAKRKAHPATAPPSCYEANPKTPPEACPAPVFQLVPALPGTVSPLEPKGKPMPQRPRPAGLKETGEAAPPGFPLPTAP